MADIDCIRIIPTVDRSRRELVALGCEPPVRVPLGSDPDAALIQAVTAITAAGGGREAAVALRADHPCRTLLAWVDGVRVVEQTQQDRAVIREFHRGLAAHVVYTDASRATRRRETGIAAVTSDLSHRSTTVDAGCILAGEVCAIDLALRSFDAVRVVRTDSLGAMHAIQTGRVPSSFSSAMGRRVRLLHEVVATRQVVLEHVAGHSGNPGNDLADRLAVARRRHTQLRTPTEAFERAVQAIVADYQACGDDIVCRMPMSA